MKTDNIKLVVADIDLTLESREFGIPEINIKAMEALHEAGIMFGVASGRNVSQIRGRTEAWGLTFEPELLIGTNGSSYYDGLTDTQYNTLVFEKEWIRVVREFLVNQNISFYVYIDDYTLFEKETERYKALKFFKERDIRLAQSPEDIYQGDFYKFLLMIESEEKAEEFIRESADLFAAHEGEFKLLKTTPISYEIVHSQTAKSIALDAFCRDHSIDLADVAAFGDADNDIEMIEAAGMGVCLRNGTEETKKAADYITELDYREGGFGDFVFRYILN